LGAGQLVVGGALGGGGCAGADMCGRGPATDKSQEQKEKRRKKKE